MSTVEVQTVQKDGVTHKWGTECPSGTEDLNLQAYEWGKKKKSNFVLL